MSSRAKVWAHRDDHRGKSHELILAGCFFSAHFQHPVIWTKKIFCRDLEELAYTRCVMASWYKKYVAAFVLLWALADLTVPGLCQADDNRIDPADSALFVSSQDTESLSTWSATGIPASDQDGSPDECFCCSPYNSPTSVFSLHASLNVHWSFVATAKQTPISLSLVPMPSSLPHEERRLSDSFSQLTAPIRC